MTDQNQLCTREIIQLKNNIIREGVQDVSIKNYSRK